MEQLIKKLEIKVSPFKRIGFSFPDVKREDKQDSLRSSPKDTCVPGTGC